MLVRAFYSGPSVSEHHAGGACLLSDRDLPVTAKGRHHNNIDGPGAGKVPGNAVGREVHPGRAGLGGPAIR